jgi:predicted transcriptional regulator of viral defense system
MPNRSLSPLESRLILRLEWDKQAVVTAEDVGDILHVSPDHARQILHRLARDRWLSQIRPGKYELIPAERGEYAFDDPNPLFIGSVLVEPYYFSYATAAFFHGLTTQAALTVFIATTQPRPRRMLVRKKEYRLVFQPAHKFFGWKLVNAYGSQVNMAEPEKTLLDSLDRPRYVGDIPEVATMLWRGKSNLDWDRLADYAVRFNSQALIQRLGYLLDQLDLRVADNIRGKLLAELGGKNKCYLGQPRKWGVGGEYSSTWQVVNNIPRHILLAEIEMQG